MSDKVNTTPQPESAFVHVYKVKPVTLLLNMLSVLFFGIVLGVPLLLFIMFIVSIFQNSPEGNSIGLLILCISGFPIVLASFLLIQVTVSFISQFFSYVKTSPSGLEHKIWPYKHIRCNWSDVNRIGKRWFFIDVVYLKSSEVIGPSISLVMTLKVFRPYLQDVIPLTGYRGWPEGQLAQDLCQYAPHVFDDEADTQSFVLDKHPQEPGALSQEDRLLAALSHISVWFSFLGIIVPIVIWISQKEKSSYLAFQALQALVFQAMAIAVNLTTSVCLTCSFFGFFLNILLGNENETLAGGLFGLIFALQLASIGLMVFGQIFFIVYGLIGSIMTFQGKDFRYLIIANRLENRLRKEAK